MSDGGKEGREKGKRLPPSPPPSLSSLSCGAGLFLAVTESNAQSLLLQQTPLPTATSPSHQRSTRGCLGSAEERRSGGEEQRRSGGTRLDGSLSDLHSAEDLQRFHFTSELRLKASPPKTSGVASPRSSTTFVHQKTKEKSCS